MTKITKNIKTHRIVFNDKRDDILITQTQYDLYSQEYDMKNANQRMTITDIDTKEILYDGRKWKIDEFQHIKKSNILDYKYVCDYWTRHEMSDECKCYDRFWCLRMTFQDNLRILWYKFEYATQITPEMQREYLENNK